MNGDADNGSSNDQTLIVCREWTDKHGLSRTERVRPLAQVVSEYTAEIERLTRERDEARSAAALNANLGSDYARERDRLRAALRDFAGMPCETAGIEDMEPGCCRTCRARALLNGEPSAHETAAIPARRYPGDEEAVRQAGGVLPYCTCPGRCDDDAHKIGCPFWQKILAARKLWHDRNVVAWACSQEAKGKECCTQWCGNPEFCTATGTDRRAVETSDGQ